MSRQPGPSTATCDLNRVLAARAMTLTEFAERVGVSIVNPSVLKNNHAEAVRFSTLTAMCDVLDCQVGDILRPDT
ncbi:helix-turn-helix domain-containing protein [Pedococcus sp. NPDC057267]|uniref:helix-turn-helix domain-containing protein n=1 Tax=Pedococcus sp. NPDC057267 TaxID=3346077 RepID=UPI00363F08E8